MFHFSHACVRSPGPEIMAALTQNPGHRDSIDLPLLHSQHQAYIKALREAGLSVTVCPSDADFPDGPFVEDTHLVLPEAVIRLNPRPLTRRHEALNLRRHLPQDRPYVEVPDSLHIDGGDIMVVGRDVYIGESGRTGRDSIQWMEKTLAPMGLLVHALKVAQGLHLKSSVTAATPDLFLLHEPDLESEGIRSLERKGRILRVPTREKLAANVLTINEHLLIPKFHPLTRASLSGLAPEIKIVEVDTSEFNKVDGALTCLSLRW